MVDTFYAQFGEDRLLGTLFESSGPQTCVEVGANDGITGSVSLHFEKAGWKCVLVEPNPDLCERLRRERTAYLFEGAASSENGSATLMLAEGATLAHAVSSLEPEAANSITRQGLTARPVTVATRRLDDILVDAGVEPGTIAFVSIDVEGHEKAVLDGFTLSRWKPRILLIEDNSLLVGNGFKARLEGEGYVRFRRTGVNDWYGRRTDSDVVGTEPERDYRASMIRARSLMMRRHVSDALVSVPVIGALFKSAHRVITGRPHG